MVSCHTVVFRRAFCGKKGNKFGRLQLMVTIGKRCLFLYHSLDLRNFLLLKFDELHTSLKFLLYLSLVTPSSRHFHSIVISHASLFTKNVVKLIFMTWNVPLQCKMYLFSPDLLKISCYIETQSNCSLVF